MFFLCVTSLRHIGLLYMSRWFFTTPCCAFRLGRLRPFLLHLHFKDVNLYFPTFYFFDTVLLIFRFTKLLLKNYLRFFLKLHISKAFIEAFTSISSLILFLLQLLLKKLPLLLL